MLGSSRLKSVRAWVDCVGVVSFDGYDFPIFLRSFPVDSPFRVPAGQFLGPLGASLKPLLKKTRGQRIKKRKGGVRARCSSLRKRVEAQRTGIEEPRRTNLSQRTESSTELSSEQGRAFVLHECFAKTSRRAFGKGLVSFRLRPSAKDSIKFFPGANRRIFRRSC
jgi:hypothetical protein